MLALEWTWPKFFVVWILKIRPNDPMKKPSQKTLSIVTCTRTTAIKAESQKLEKAVDVCIESICANMQSVTEIEV